MNTPSKARDTFALRLGEFERRLLELAAERRKKPLSTYIRDQALRAAREELAVETPGAA